MTRMTGGTGTATLQFEPRAAEELPGIRLTAKICELCGRVFFRDARQRECKACAALLALPPEPIPAEVEADTRRASWLMQHAKKEAANRERDRKRKAEERRRLKMEQTRTDLPLRRALLERARENERRRRAEEA